MNKSNAVIFHVILVKHYDLDGLRLLLVLVVVVLVDLVREHVEQLGLRDEAGHPNQNQRGEQGVPAIQQILVYGKLAALLGGIATTACFDFGTGVLLSVAALIATVPRARFVYRMAPIHMVAVVPPDLVLGLVGLVAVRAQFAVAVDGVLVALEVLLACSQKNLVVLVQTDALVDVRYDQL